MWIKSIDKSTFVDYNVIIPTGQATIILMIIIAQRNQIVNMTVKFII